MPRLKGAGPVFRRVANDLKARIEAGEYQQGKRIPAEDDLAATYEVARGTVRRAIRLLEYECILEVRHGHGTFVRLRTEPEIVDLVTGQRVLSRMPTLAEQQELDIPETTPVLVVLAADDSADSAAVYPSDRVVLQCP